MKQDAPAPVKYQPDHRVDAVGLSVHLGGVPQTFQILVEPPLETTQAGAVR